MFLSNITFLNHPKIFLKISIRFTNVIIGLSLNPPFYFPMSYEFLVYQKIIYISGDTVNMLCWGRKQTPCLHIECIRWNTRMSDIRQIVCSRNCVYRLQGNGCRQQPEMNWWISGSIFCCCVCVPLIVYCLYNGIDL